MNEFIYLAQFDNGENWEDHENWTSETPHRTREGCEKEIIMLGYSPYAKYVKNSDRSILEYRKMESWGWGDETAEILELPLSE